MDGKGLGYLRPHPIEARSLSVVAIGTTLFLEYYPLYTVLRQQCAVRCWCARKEVDYLRKRVCSAVLIQSAWKTYVARKKLILLKQAAIILQAHYKGRLARKKFAVDLEKFRQEIERKRKEEEALRKKRERERLEVQRRESESHSWTIP